MPAKKALTTAKKMEILGTVASRQKGRTPLMAVYVNNETAMATDGRALLAIPIDHAPGLWPTKAGLRDATAKGKSGYVNDDGTLNVQAPTYWHSCVPQPSQLEPGFLGLSSSMESMLSNAMPGDVFSLTMPGSDVVIWLDPILAGTLVKAIRALGVKDGIAIRVSNMSSNPILVFIATGIEHAVLYTIKPSDNPRPLIRWQ